MGNILLYVAIGLGIVFVILLILAAAGKGEGLRKWLGPIGGLVLAIVAFFGIKNATGGKDLDKIHAENERLTKELARLKDESDKLNAKYAQDKSEYEAKIANLENSLATSEAEREKAAKELADTASKTPMEWFNSLPADDKKKIKDEIDKGINWI